MDKKVEKVVMQHLASKLFIERWLEKASRYNQDLIEDCFDVFFTQFVVFNRLYNDAYSLIKARGEIHNMMNLPLFKEEFKKNRSIGDQKASTVCVAFFLLKKAKEIIGNNKESLKTFIDVIPAFNICLKDGEPQKKKDEALLQGLKAADDEVVLFYLLKTVYQIRCNTFHGEKAMTERQKNLLQASNAFLKTIIEAMLDSFLPKK